MKSVLNIFGSPHKNGFTAKLNNCALDHIDKYGLNSIYVYDRNIKPCIDCKLCASKEGCCFDDMDDIDIMLRESDLIIIATPIYNMSFPAPLKAVIDRMQRYFMARFFLGINPPIKKSKSAILLATCGSESINEVDIIKEQLRRTFTIINTRLVETILWDGTDNKDFDIELKISDAHEKIKEVIKKIGY